MQSIRLKLRLTYQDVDEKNRHRNKQKTVSRKEDKIKKNGFSSASVISE